MARGVPAGRPEQGFVPYVPRVVPRHFMPDPGGPRVHTVDATLAFADVSGFTKLAERLARQGREGAEQLTGIIGRCFDSLLAVAYANGGSLVKFGGDALLLVFEGEHHPERACRSAIGMQTALRELGPIEAGGAKVRLRMSMGLHSGDVHLYLVGTSHREAILTGPAASAVVGMEKEAAAGEAVLSPAIAARLPEACLGAERPGGGRLLRRSPIDADLDPLPPEPPRAADDLARCLSTAVRTHVASGDDTPEHRNAAVAFVQFTGVDALVERDGAEAVAAALHGLVSTCQHACDRQRVTFIDSDVDADGGKLLLAAGAPRVVGDDEERLLLALREVLEHETPLRVRAGVNRGNVFAGAIGPAYRRSYTTMGDPTNLAARVMARAAPGTLLATPAVLERTRTRFVTEPVEPFMVKGKSLRVAASVVGPVLGRDRSETLIAPDVLLVGRAAELTALADAAAAARKGRGGIVEIVGEPGLGKTRLVQELRAQIGRVPRIQIVCEAYSASTPYAAARELLRPIAGLSAADDDVTVRALLDALVADQDPALLPWVPLLAIACGASAEATPEVAALGADFRQQRLHETVASFLVPHITHPRLVEIEDAQCMDVASAELLAAVLGPVAAGSWLVAVTRREGEEGFHVADESALRLHPEPLSAADTRQLAEVLTESAPLRPDVLDVAVERSGGNPQFLHDLVRAAAVGGGALPDSIEAAATERIDRLAPDDRALIRRAAVLGVSFRADWLDAVLPAGLAADAGTWNRLAAYFERSPDGAVHFRRAVVREVAYAGLPFAVRRSLHAAAAARIVPSLDERPDLVTVLSLHCYLAGDSAGAWRHGVAAAELAGTRFAHADAARLYCRALDAAQHLSLGSTELASVWAALGHAHEAVGDPAAATAAWTSARRLLAGSDPVGEAELLGHTALLTMDAGGVRNAVRWARRGLRVLEGRTDTAAGASRAALTVTLATIRQRQGRMQEAGLLARAAIAEAERTGAEAALARASYILDWALVESGAVPAGGSERALEIYERLGETWRTSFVLNNLGGFAYRDGRWDDAAALWQRAAAATDRAGDVIGTAYAELNLGELRSDQGRLEDGERHLSAALRVFHTTGQEFGIAAGTVQLGRAAVRAGRHVAGVDLILEAAGRFRSLGCESDLAHAQMLLAEADVFSGEPAAALDAVEALLAPARDLTRLQPLLLRIRGLALAQLGEADAAAEALGESLAAARSQESLLDVALALDALGRLGLGGSAADDRERDRILERLGVTRVPQTLITRVPDAVGAPGRQGKRPGAGVPS